jgi:hypothetical protein
MAEPPKYPYTTVPGKLRDLLKKAPNMGRPEKVTVAWLKTAGWTSSNDASMIPVLRFVGLLGADGRPTELWDAIRVATKENRAIFGTALREAYADLFALYPDANRKDTEALRNFFRAQSSGGEQVQAKLVQTFQILAEFGDFDGVASLDVTRADRKAPGDEKRGRASSSVDRAPLVAPGLTLNVSIQLQLPATADAEVYDKLFASMRQHLMSLSEETA